MSYQVRTFLDIHMDTIRARADELVSNHGEDNWLDAFKRAAFELDPVTGEFDNDSETCCSREAFWSGAEQYFKLINGNWKLPLDRGLEIKDFALVRQALRSLEAPCEGDEQVGGKSQQQQDMGRGTPSHVVRNSRAVSGLCAPGAPGDGVAVVGPLGGSCDSPSSHRLTDNQYCGFAHANGYEHEIVFVRYMNDKSTITRLLDNKAREGKLGQAQVILRSLDFEPRFRIHYEQGLFMKEINLIYGQGASCSKGLSVGMYRQELLSRVRAATSDSETEMLALFEWLSRSMGMNFYYLRPASDFYRFIRGGDMDMHTDSDEVAPEISCKVGRCIRPEIANGSGCNFWASYGFAPVFTDGSMGSLVKKLIPCRDTLTGFGEFMLRSNYSIALLEEGDGGKFMAEFMRWYRKELGGRRITMLSDIHRSVVNEKMDVTTAVSTAVQEYLVELLVNKVGQMSEDRIYSGLKAALQGLLEVDSSNIVPGCYSLNRLVWLAIFGPSILNWNKCWYHSRLL